MKTKTLMLLIAAVLMTEIAAAEEAYTLKGRVVQTTDGAAVEMATVRLFRYEQKNGATDSVLVRGGQTDLNGWYVLENVPEGTYAILVSSIGFIPEKTTVRVPGKNNETNVQVKTVSLREDVQALATVDVKGSAAEMTVKGDTIEYNTAAYKVQDGAMVEDLLKKMNGIEVDKEGKVTVNGETITAVRIDGKKFFGSFP